LTVAEPSGNTGTNPFGNIAMNVGWQFHPAAMFPVSSLIAVACPLEGVEFELSGDFLNGQ
jgi:hypothetical protein